MLVWLPHTRLLPCWSNGFSFWGFVRVLSLMPNRFTHDGRVRFWDRVRTDGLLTVGVESARRAWFRRMTAIDLTGQVRFRVAQRQLGAPGARPTAQQLYPERVRNRKRNRLIERIGLCVLAVLLVAVCATGGYALWYSNALDGALSMGSEQDASVDSVLVRPETGKPFYVLLLGSDSREGSGTSKNPDMQGDNQRSDVMILARVDAGKKQVTLVSVPRDTPYTLDGGSVVKINEVYNIEGAAGSIKPCRS